MALSPESSLTLTSVNVCSSPIRQLEVHWAAHEALMNDSIFVSCKMTEFLEDLRLHFVCTDVQFDSHEHQPVCSGHAF
jgi:hypothetical protein